MKRTLSLVTYLAILVGAYHWTHSTSGFLVTGCGLVLLADRYVWALVPWPQLAWRREAVTCLGSFLVGATASYFMRPGNVPIWEAAYRGVVACLLIVLVEAGPRLAGTHARLARAAAALGLVLIVPVVAALHPIHTVPRRTPEAFGLAFEDVRFRSDDGIELAGWLIPHPSPRGNVIFCHGHGRNCGHVAGVLQSLHDAGLNVLAFDFRGHGDSGGHSTTFGQREVGDLVAAGRFMSRRCPGQPMVLAGVSLGAAVALQALPRMPHVRGVWSEGAFARFDHVVDHFFSRLPAALRRPVVACYYRLGWLDCGLWAPSVSPLDCLRGVTVPVFFCHATKDDLVPFTEAQALYQSYAGPKECWWVDGASHYNVRQRNHEEYPRRLRAFLEKCLAGRAD